WPCAQQVKHWNLPSPSEDGRVDPFHVVCERWRVQASRSLPVVSRYVQKLAQSFPDLYGGARERTRTSLDLREVSSAEFNTIVLQLIYDFWTFQAAAKPPVTYKEP